MSSPSSAAPFLCRAPPTGLHLSAATQPTPPPPSCCRAAPPLLKSLLLRRSLAAGGVLTAEGGGRVGGGFADRKIDLPDDLLSSTAKGNDAGKVSLDFLDVVKDQAVSESNIPLSPQWLYAKHSDSKQDIRGPNSLSLGNSADLTQKESDKKDWRKLENESARRWREEERETGLLGRRDRKKTERRVETASARDSTESRNLTPSERWTDANNRNASNETKRDSKWSSRWGPEEKEKEQRVEKKTDFEKEEAHNDVQSAVSVNRDADTRDKWRPRHRVDSNAAAPSPYRAAPGFGPGKGKVDGPATGFTVGRGRSSVAPHTKPPLGSTIGVDQGDKSENFPGKPSLSVDSFRYPRAKILDIYRFQKLDPISIMKPLSVEEVPGVTQVANVEPLAFVAPDAVEEGILKDMWKGNITGSGASYNPSIQQKVTESAKGVDVIDCFEDVLPPCITEDGIASYHDLAATDGFQAEERSAKYATDFTALGKELERVQIGDAGNDAHLKATENWQPIDSASTNKHIFDDIEHAAMAFGSKLPDEMNTLFTSQSVEGSGDLLYPQYDKNSNRLEGASPEELTLYYRDPQGEIQGPFLGVDILSWFEQGFFGIDLPVRLADASEDAPFQELGDVMTHLRVQEGHFTSTDTSATVENLGGSAPGEINDMSTLNNQGWCFSDFDNQQEQQAHSMMSEHDFPSQLPFMEGKSFHDSSTIDEEIVFPGRPGSGGSLAGRHLRSADGPLKKSAGYSFNSDDTKDYGLPTQNNDKLHPFGLLWSELESNPSRQNQPLSMPSAVDMPGHLMDQSTSSFMGVHDTNIEETWPTFNDKGPISNSNIFGELLENPQFIHNEHEPNHRELAERMMSRQIQQSIQQRNLLSQFGNLNESHLEQVPARNSVQQQLSNQSFSELEHFLALQQQRQLELQQQQQLQEQQQQQQLQQIYMQERESQANQFLLEQIIHGSARDPGFPQSHMDPGMGNNVLDQMLLKQHILRDSQMHLHQPSRHSDPFVEQFVHANMGQGTHRDRQADILELMQHARHERLRSQQMLQQEELQARQMQMGLRQRQEIDSVWAVDVPDPFLRNHGGSHRAHSAAFSPPAFSPLDMFQQQQRASHDEQLREIERLQLQDLVKRGLYDPGTIPFERAMPLQGGRSGISLDMANAMSRSQVMDMQDPPRHLWSAGNLGSLNSGTLSHHPHHSLVSNEFNIPHMDSEVHRPDIDSRRSSDWLEPHLQLRHLNAEQQKREQHFDEDNSKRVLMELLHQNSSHQPGQANNLYEGEMLESRAPSGFFSGSSSTDHLFNFAQDRDAILNNSTFSPFVNIAGQENQFRLAEEQAGSLNGTGRLAGRLNSENYVDGESVFPGMNQSSSLIFTNSNGMPFVDRDFTVVEAKNRVPKVEDMMKGLDVSESISKLPGMSAFDNREMPVSSISRQSSITIAGTQTGFYNENMGHSDSFAEDIALGHERMPTVLPRVSENVLLKRPPVSRPLSSQEGSSARASDVATKVVNPSIGASDGTVRDVGGNAVLQADSTTTKKDMRFRRTNSCSDADVSETSFIDMLKSNARKPLQAEANAEAQGGKSGKKKGKKGRQIDPALLGFKVSSNRIMMGEIQRIED
ncbi:hypothetical protein KSS87_018526 [Heliosperma pusillum]|nr:hypothetical protein KSS87_018526 [Heliosperma pusillum]